jgi:hypothetical protein
MELVPEHENRIRRCGASAAPGRLQSVKQALPMNIGISQNFHNPLEEEGIRFRDMENFPCG